MVFVLGSAFMVACFWMVPFFTMPRITVPMPFTLKAWSMGTVPVGEPPSNAVAGCVCAASVRRVFASVAGLSVVYW